MTKSGKIIIVIAIIIFILAIISTEITYRPKIRLINDVRAIYDLIKDVSETEIVEIIIDNGYDYLGTHYDVVGSGVIFLDEVSSVMLSRNGMCAVKLPYSDNVMFQDYTCPTYRLVDGEIVVITDSE